MENQALRHPNGAILRTHLGDIPLLARGKVRDIYDLGDHLLLVTTDRLSAFDCVLPTPIPDKGRVLNQISVFWFHRFSDVVRNHLVSPEFDDFPQSLRPFRDQLEGRTMLVRKAAMFAVECVARGYLSGSGWKEYRSSGAVCGIPIPAGMKESGKLPEPIFTPATKAQSGHDMNISFDEATQYVPAGYLSQLRQLTLRIYQEAAEYAEARDILIADTKFEFGLIDGEIVLGDEVLTPDSSRFWPKNEWNPGGPQPSFDKQFVRDYLETLDWDKVDPAPALPDEIAQRTSEKYREAYRLLTGMAL